MHMEIQDDQKLVTIWLTNQDQQNPEIPEILEPICRQYRDQNYQVAMFLSGKAPLYEQTRDLLLYNRRRLAERDVQAGIAT